MPKLGSEAAVKAREAGESSGFTPLEEGRYRARLTEVKAKTASTGNPMWVWTYEIISGLAPLADGKGKGRKQWNNTVLTDAAMWKVAESFAAFGVPTDTDTDELNGCTVVLEISQRVIQQGQREGQTGNNIDRVMPDLDERAIRHKSASFEGGSTGGPQDRPAAAVPAGVTDRF